MAEFAVVDQVDAGVALAGDHVGDRRPQAAQVLFLVAEVPGGALLVERDQVLRPRQAARVAGQDPVRHISSSRLRPSSDDLPRAEYERAVKPAQYLMPR